MSYGLRKHFERSGHSLFYCMLSEGRTDASANSGCITLITYKRRFNEDLIVAQLEPEGSVLYSPDSYHWNMFGFRLMQSMRLHPVSKIHLILSFHLHLCLANGLLP